MRPPEEVQRELVRQWMAKAEQDFGLARHLASENTPYTFAVAFHAQQAAEKFLKAFLVRQQIDFPKTHDLDELLDLVTLADPVLAASIHDCVVLTPYEVRIRYPGDSPEITMELAQAALQLAAKVRDCVLAVLEPYLGPPLS